MEKIITKQWTLAARDYLKSLFYAVAVPVLAILQTLIDTQLVGGELTTTKLIIYTAVGAAVSHLLRKLKEPSKEITVKPLNERTPPPMGDPTHPKRTNA